MQLREYVTRQDHLHAHAKRLFIAELLEEAQRILSFNIVNSGDTTALQLSQRALHEGARQRGIRLFDDAIDEAGCFFLL